MPHEVADLEPVLLMLSKQDLDDVQVMNPFLLWLTSILVIFVCSKM